MVSTGDYVGGVFMSEYYTAIQSNGTQLGFISQPKYECPVHGVTEHVINVTIESHKADYCMLCAFEKMEELGVSKVTICKPQP